MDVRGGSVINNPNCVSLALAIKLRDAGFPQETTFFVHCDPGENFGTVLMPRPEPYELEFREGTQIAAPTATEIYLASNRHPSCNVAMPDEAALNYLKLGGETE